MLSVEIRYDLRWPEELLQRRTQYMVDVTGREVERSIKDNIMRSISFYGTGLAALKPDTVRKKRGLRYPRKPLYALGMLYNAIHYYTGHRENQGTVGIKEVGKVSRRFVAWAQQFGFYKGGRARPFFGIGPSLRKRVSAHWEDWLKRLVTQKFGVVKQGRMTF